MLRLLTSDLRSLVNLAFHREGRRVLIGSLLSLTFLFLVADTFGKFFASTTGAWPGAGEPASLRGLMATALSPGLLLATWFGFSGGPRQLFELPQLPLWLTAPLRAPSVLLATWLRFGLLIAVWCAAVCGPLAAHLAHAEGGTLTWWQLFAACTALSLPTTAFVLGLQVVLLRFFSGRWTRVLFAALSALGSLAFSMLLLIGAIGRDDAAADLFALARGRAAFPLILDAPARLLEGFAIGHVSARAAVDCLVLTGSAALALLMLSAFYRRSWANAQRAVAPLRRSSALRRWPVSAAGVVFRKELAQIAHQPGQLLGLLVSTLFVVVLAGSRLFGREIVPDDALGPDARAVLILLATWLVAQVTIVPGSVLRVALMDGAQWSLYVLAPASPRAILAGKVGAIALLQAWPATVAAVVGRAQLDASGTALLAFGAIVPVAVLWTAAVCCFVGTLPGVVRPRPERNPILALVAVAIAILLLQLTAVLALVAGSWLIGFQGGHGALVELSDTGRWLTVIVATWCVGLLACAGAFLVAARQLRRLTRPER